MKKENNTILFSSSECGDDDYYNLLLSLRQADKERSEPIIVIADLGLWNGRQSGYRIIGSGNISECFSSDYDPEWYLDRYDLRCDEVHHDGTNHFLYRRLKPDVDISVFKEKICNGICNRQDILKFTSSLRHEIVKALCL